MKQKNIVFTNHAYERMKERGVEVNEVIDCILNGKKVEAKHGRVRYIKSFSLGVKYREKFYRDKQIEVICAEEEDRITVITVIVKLGEF